MRNLLDEIIAYAVIAFMIFLFIFLGAQFIRSMSRECLRFEEVVKTRDAYRWGYVWTSKGYTYSQIPDGKEEYKVNECKEYKPE